MHKKWFDIDFWLIVLLAFLVGCLLGYNCQAKKAKALSEAKQVKALSQVSAEIAGAGDEGYRIVYQKGLKPQTVAITTFTTGGER